MLAVIIIVMWIILTVFLIYKLGIKVNQLAREIEDTDDNFIRDKEGMIQEKIFHSSCKRDINEIETQIANEIIKKNGGSND